MFNKQELKDTQELSKSTNQIGKGTVIHGNIETFGDLRIDGKLVGDLKTKSKAVFGQSSVVEGNVIAQNAEVEGHITGTVQVTDVLILKTTAIVDGDIVTDKLIVESGALFNGGCKMGEKSKEIKIGNKEQATLLKAQS